MDKYFIVRIAWVFGVNGSNFIKTMLKVGKSHDEGKVVENGFKPLPTWRDAIKRYLEILKKDGFFDELN